MLTEGRNASTSPTRSRVLLDQDVGHMSVQTPQGMNVSDLKRWDSFLHDDYSLEVVLQLQNSQAECERELRPHRLDETVREGQGPPVRWTTSTTGNCTTRGNDTTSVVTNNERGVVTFGDFKSCSVCFEIPEQGLRLRRLTGLGKDGRSSERSSMSTVTTTTPTRTAPAQQLQHIKGTRSNLSQFVAQKTSFKSVFFDPGSTGKHVTQTRNLPPPS
jgi:hypothetical protein